MSITQIAEVNLGFLTLGCGTQAAMKGNSSWERTIQESVKIGSGLETVEEHRNEPYRRGRA